MLCGVTGDKLAAGAGQRRGRSAHDFRNFRPGRQRSDGMGSVEMTALVRTVEVLMSPLEWGSQDAWLAESLKRVRELRGRPESTAPTGTIAELEELLRLEGDEPGWLEAALASAAGGCGWGGLSPWVTEDCLPVVSLRCALAAGLTILHRQHAWRSTLGQVCDDVNAGMALFRQNGLREIARNVRWGELLEEEPRRDCLLDLITRQAGYTAASAGSIREDYRELELSGRSYRLIAKRVPAGDLHPEPGVLVLMDRLGPELPTTRELRVTFGLRGREPQVALLAAEGLSNAAIAQRLRLSAHTVRHYLERVLTRLGLHSRKALALHLMGAEREKPR
jgi:DNA-binding CsgD family transcriptional regulator